MKMDTEVTIVMYHYVREIKSSRFPGIKGLEIKDFKGQVEFLRHNYNIISVEHLIAAIHEGEKLPPKAALLTFDDAYIDHYMYAFPILHNLGIQGSFYVPAKMIIENKVLDVNKIHFVLATMQDVNLLIKQLFKEIDIIRRECELPDNEVLYKTYAITNGKDTDEVMFVKRMLQKVLPQPYRSELVNRMFEEAIGMDEVAFSKELYINKEQMRHMVAGGMHLGNHTYSHPWLNTLSTSDQKMEILSCNKLLEDVGVDMKYWTMCFPHGGHNEDTLNILKDLGCKLGFSVKVKVANTKNDNFLALPRLDTNDLPKSLNK
jgi:peptidoglycan/xylan/chitin deacetylase (PgdA/CDA1 family)